MRLIEDPADWGDTYIWLALDSETKLLISHLVGKRDAASADAFVADFSRSLHLMWRCQFTSLGGHPKTGQRWSGQNRPTGLTQDKNLFLPCRLLFRQGHLRESPRISRIVSAGNWSG